MEVTPKSPGSILDSPSPASIYAMMFAGERSLAALRRYPVAGHRGVTFNRHLKFAVLHLETAVECRRLRSLAVK